MSYLRTTIPLAKEICRWYGDRGEVVQTCTRESIRGPLNTRIRKVNESKLVEVQ